MRWVRKKRPPETHKRPSTLAGKKVLECSQWYLKYTSSTGKIGLKSVLSSPLSLGETFRFCRCLVLHALGRG